MYLIQLTDLHIGKEGEETAGVDVRDNFQRALKKVKERNPDRLVITGDLCYGEGEKEVYVWVQGQLKELGLPVDLIAGNHDDSVLMGEVFERQIHAGSKELFFAREWAAWQVLFLDTRPAKMSDIQLEWLSFQLKRNHGPVLIFMHHPPAFFRLPHMDRKHAFKQIEEVQSLVKESERDIEVFCGHYHIEKSLRMGRLAIHISPSLFYQMDMHREDFAVDHYRPGFREIWLEEGRLYSTVTYLEAGVINR